MVFHLIEGAVDVHVEAEKFVLAKADTCCAPGFSPVTLVNRDPASPSYLFIADESPLHRKLGVYEQRDASGAPAMAS